MPRKYHLINTIFQNLIKKRKQRKKPTIICGLNNKANGSSILKQHSIYQTPEKIAWDTQEPDTGQYAWVEKRQRGGQENIFSGKPLKGFNQ